MLLAPLAALVQALLRSPPALRPAPPRAVRSAEPAPDHDPGPAAQTPRRLPSAGFPGVDFPNIDAADSAVPTAGAALGFTPHASLMQGSQGAPWPALLGTFAVKRGPENVGPSVYRTDTRESSSSCPRRSPPIPHRYPPMSDRGSKAIPGSSPFDSDGRSAPRGLPHRTHFRSAGRLGTACLHLSSMARMHLSSSIACGR